MGEALEKRKADRSELDKPTEEKQSQCTNVQCSRMKEPSLRATGIREALVDARMHRRKPSPRISLLLERAEDSAELDTSLRGKKGGGGPPPPKINDVDKDQDNLTYTIENQAMAMDLKILELNFWARFLKDEVGPMGTKVKTNQLFMSKQLDKQRKAWQGLANELRNIIYTKAQATDEAAGLTMEHLEKQFKVVSSLFLFQQIKFRDLIKKIKEEEGELKKHLTKKSTDVKVEMKAAKRNLGKA